MPRWRFAAWLGVGMAAALWSTAALAHSELLGSNPADGAIVSPAPEWVIARFSTEITTDGSTIVVLDAAGNPVGQGGVDLDDPDHASLKAALPADLPSGRYNVRWAITSAADNDDHRTEGSFSFEVR